MGGRLFRDGQVIEYTAHLRQFRRCSQVMDRAPGDVRILQEAGNDQAVLEPVKQLIVHADVGLHLARVHGIDGYTAAFQQVSKFPNG